MRYLVLDTCAVIHIIRQDKKGQDCLNWINSLNTQPVQVISVVTKAELLTFSVIAGWKANKIKFLDDFLKGVTYVDILHTDKNLIDNYKLIDCYSKNKLPDSNGNFKKGSHNNIGKNDIWIGATALTLNATLLTADKDFDHLNGTILNVQRF
ncbi:MULTISPECIES: type II toxin-antitoxin system VapC family toxin [unclassified Polaribacter]|uniref:type II toxin-antitoxin system VapC family toxin n=1 Tax=unclassified Polaribacter TaxID=196858 RepID=UPI0011BD6E6F|nr:MULTISPECIES: type II toxin-antitoxin system VapC family toxin [unclassified Polaribacter]TXD50452.1 type II toxin-antitoxin system VapC family toxin [Polaribacter sp. IC063]TXD57095.1 type II toxin-antitoxin system VapC family toxin [Polaribacter sp. IC066]